MKDAANTGVCLINRWVKMSMAPISLDQILALVGPLDDAPGSNTPRERFRNHLTTNVKEVGSIRDYIEECLRTSGEQYSRALQDLVNHLGSFLGFKTNFGRYQGVQGQIGFDGHWISLVTNFHIVVEVKTTEVYAVNTEALVGYMNALISAQQIPNRESVLGLYVIGRPDPKIRQLEHAIVAQRRTDELRVSSISSLLSLAEMMQDYDVTHEDILTVLRPSGPKVDDVVSLMSRLVAGSGTTPSALTVLDTLTDDQVAQLETPDTTQSTTRYWLTPVAANDSQTAEEVVKSLVGEEKIYAFGDKTKKRAPVMPGDWICFYAAQVGIVAHAQISSEVENKIHPKIRDPKTFHWVFRLQDVHVYTDKPVVIDAALRQQLDAFKGKSVGSIWAWFVQRTHIVSQHDFSSIARL